LDGVRKTCLPSDHAAQAGISACVWRDSDPSQKNVAFQWGGAIHLLGMLHAASDVANPMAGFHKI